MQTTSVPPTGPARGTSPVRGVVLVAVAVVLGFFILRAIDDTGRRARPSPRRRRPTASDAPTTATAPPDRPSHGGAPSRGPPAEVIVLVANASGVQGAAAEQTDGASGRRLPDARRPANAPEQQSRPPRCSPSPGSRPRPPRWPTAIGAPESRSQPMPDPPPRRPGRRQRRWCCSAPTWPRG